MVKRAKKQKRSPYLSKKKEEVAVVAVVVVVVALLFIRLFPTLSAPNVTQCEADAVMFVAGVMNYGF